MNMTLRPFVIYVSTPKTIYAYAASIKKVGKLEAESMNLAKGSSLPSNMSSDSHSDEGREWIFSGS